MDERSRYRDFLRPNPRRELEDELRFHIETETEELIAAGRSPAAARQEALEKFGDVDRFLADCGDSDRRRLGRRRRARLLDVLRQDFRYAVRGLVRRPAFSISAILVLAIGVGANASVLSVVDHLFLRAPAGVEAPGQLKRLFVERERGNGEKYFQVRFSMPEARIIAAAVNDAFPAAIYYRARALLATGAGASTPFMGAWVSPAYFTILGVRLHMGSAFGGDDSLPGAPPTAIVSWRYWQRTLGADPRVVGRVLVVDGVAVTVQGVAERGFTGLDVDVTDIFFPIESLALMSGDRGPAWFNQWGTIAFRVLARVPDEADEPQLASRVELAVQSATLERQRERPSYRAARVLRAIPAPLLTSRGPEEASRNEAIAAALAGLQLLLLAIATANVGNLMLGRAMDRQREVAVKLALGMGRLRLAGQVAIESFFIASLASVGALVAATWTGSVLRSMVIPRTELAVGPVDMRIAVIALATGLIAGLFAAAVPLVATMRIELVEMLKGTSRDGGGRSRTRSFLVGMQAALAMMLLLGTGLVARSLYNLRHDDLGIDVPRGLIVTTEAGKTAVPLTEIARVARTIAGVSGVALTAEAPLFSQLGARSLFTRDRDSIRAIGGDAGYVAAEPGYLRVIGTRLTSGREFTIEDRAGSMPVMIASKEFARRAWPGRNPLGECVRVDRPDGDCYTVVGIAQDARVFDIIEDPRPTFYVPLDQRPDREPNVEPAVNAIAISVSGDVAPVMEKLREIVGDTGTTIRTRHVIAMRELLEPRYEPWEQAARLFAGFTVLAMLLTIIGLYGVLNYLVTLRRRELGVRMALGADRAMVLRMILREGVVKLVAGVVFGIGVTWFAERALQPLLFEVSPRDPLAITAAVLALLAAGLVAGLLPARRASRLDPSDALRQE
jgi:putative ABC transport system permease protein